MKIGVIGYGVVGQATAATLRLIGHEVFVHDLNPQRMAAGISDGLDRRAEANDVEVDFLCVPEGHLNEALDGLPTESLAVIRSTVPPGTTDSLAAYFSRPMAYMPEFLKEATAQWDALNPAFMLVGTHDATQGDLLTRIFAPLLVPIIRVEPAIAEMVKISLNAYLHTIISFWNEIHLICERTGLASHVVGKICSQDPRVPSYGATMHGKPVGGRCLPKDVTQLINFAGELGYSADLLKEAQRVNAKLAENAAVAGEQVRVGGDSSSVQRRNGPVPLAA